MSNLSPTSNTPHNDSPGGHDPTSRPAVGPLLLPAESQEPRRPSIQFLAHANASLPTGRPKQGREKRRMSSPPPPPVFQPRVSFDTFDKHSDNIEENSFTLIAKHKDYEYTKRSRTFLCGCDDNDYSDYALQWLIDELVDDGDEIVCLRVVEKLDGSSERHLETGRYRTEANALMKQFQAKNHENKAINLILEFAVGKVNKVIDEMINLYEPAILVVGTRGRNLGGFQGLLPGSVSKYCLQSSPVPVIVVLPSSKRDKSRVKRAQDPSRQEYKSLLEKSGPQAGYTLSASSRNSFIAPEDNHNVPGVEANAVADALGSALPLEASPLAQVQTAPKQGGDTTVPAAKEQDLGNLMKSPALQNLDSPETSDSSSSDGEVSVAVSAVERRTKALEEKRDAAVPSGTTVES